MHHYTYVLWDEQTSEYYIGVRSCYCEPNDDDYQGSMVTWKLSDARKAKLKKRVLVEYSTREEAEYWEAVAIEEHILNPYNRNFHLPGGGYVSMKDKLDY
jgi:hypothetical protein